MEEIGPKVVCQSGALRSVKKDVIKILQLMITGAARRTLPLF